MYKGGENSVDPSMHFHPSDLCSGYSWGRWKPVLTNSSLLPIRSGLPAPNPSPMASVPTLMHRVTGPLWAQ